MGRLAQRQAPPREQEPHGTASSATRRPAPGPHLHRQRLAMLGELLQDGVRGLDALLVLLSLRSTAAEGPVEGGQAAAVALGCRRAAALAVTAGPMSEGPLRAVMHSEDDHASHCAPLAPIAA